MARRIRVHVKPGSRVESVDVRSDGVWVIRVRERAVDGRANDALVKALAGHIGCPQRSIAILSGHASRRKVVELPD